MSRALDDLDSRFRPLAMELLARCLENHLPLMIVDTLRTAEEHEENLRKKLSWTKNSKHLAQPSEGKSLAIDVCPYEQFALHGANKLAWTAADPIWLRIGEIGEALGLRWGGRWQQRDLGHFEYVGE